MSGAVDAQNPEPLEFIGVRAHVNLAVKINSASALGILLAEGSSVEIATRLAGRRTQRLREPSNHMNCLIS
jgi:hypothetical protein